MGNYNSIAGQNIERIAALSDGIFAVAMTLLVLERFPINRKRSRFVWASNIRSG